MKFKILYLFVIWSLALGASALALGQAGTDMAVLSAGVGARPLGLGGAFTAISDTADAPYWNAAGLGWITSCEITTSQTKLSTDADHYYLSYVSPLWGGTFGLSWVQLSLGQITITSSEVDENNQVQTLGIFSYFSNAYLFSYGKKLNDQFSLGVTGKYLTNDMGTVAGGQASGYSFSPALLAKLKNVPLSVGLVLDDIFNQITWGTGAVETFTPNLRLGFAYRPEKIGLFSFDISQPVKSDHSPSLAAGYEWKADCLSLRAGYSPDGLSAGAGFESGHIRLDYAYVAQAGLSSGNVNRVSLTGIW